MIKNWFTILLRYLKRDKANTFINISGLSLGMLVFILIFIYVKHEFSYDNFHKDRERIFRITKVNETGESNFMGNNLQAMLPAPLYDALKEQATGLQAVTRINKRGIITATVAGKKFYEDFHYTADHELFEVFTFNFIQGDQQSALKNRRTIALSERTARRYFGTTDVLGKEVEFTGIVSLGIFTVDAIFADFPSNSSFQFNIIFNLPDYATITQPGDLDNWRNWNYNFFVKISDKEQASTLANTVGAILKEKNPESGKSTYFMEPFSSLYLHSTAGFSITPSADLNRIYILSTIAVFVLLMACINYVSLVTARSFIRAKEVGIRKMSGAMRNNLVYQFITETITINFLAMIIAVCTTWLIFPVYKDFIGKQIPFNLLNDALVFITLFAIPLLVGILAGIYPALILSAYKPVKILKGAFARSSEGTSLRDALTVFQFTLTGLLIIGTIVLNRQLHFIEVNDPGYQRDHILRISLLDNVAREKYKLLQTELEKDSRILSTSVSTALPNYVGALQSKTWTNEQGEFNVSLYSASADPGFVGLFGLSIVNGRNFLPGEPEKNAFIINETAAKTYGWDNPVGMEFIESETKDTVRIIGVVRDFHLASYREPIRPFVLESLTNPFFAFNLSIKISQDDIPGTLAFIENTYNKFATGNLPFKYTFFDEQFENDYKTDRQLGSLITVVSFLALGIACLGLYSLSTYSISIRLKEIGIRKVLGAGTGQLIYRLARKQLLLVTVSFGIACPAAYFSANEWLSDFAYHTELNWIIFMCALFLLLLIAVCTVGSQTWKATQQNPTEILRSE